MIDVNDNIIISREEAKHLGLKRYFTEISCRRGHASERYARTGHCVLCCAVTNSGRHLLPKVAKYKSDWARRNREKINRCVKNLRYTDIEKHREQRRLYYLRNAE